MEDTDKVARAWRKAWEEADDLVDVPEVCHGCSMPADGGRDEDGPLCAACARALEEEWTRQMRRAMARIADALGQDEPFDPTEVADEVCRRLASAEDT